MLTLQQILFHNNAKKRVKKNNEDFEEDFVPEEDADDDEPVMVNLDDKDFANSQRIDESLSALKGITSASMQFR